MFLQVWTRLTISLLRSSCEKKQTPKNVCTQFSGVNIWIRLLLKHVSIVFSYCLDIRKQSTNCSFDLGLNKSERRILTVLKIRGKKWIMGICLPLEWDWTRALSNHVTWNTVKTLTWKHTEGRLTATFRTAVAGRLLSHVSSKLPGLLLSPFTHSLLWVSRKHQRVVPAG